MSRSKAKTRRYPEAPVSYLEGVPMKLSDSFRRPPRVALPFNVVVNDLDNVLRDLDYDFSLEDSVVRNATEQRRIWEEAEKKKRDQEEAVRKAKEEADAAATAATAAASASKSSSSSASSDTSSPINSTSSANNANNNSATRPSSIRSPKPEVPRRPHPSSLPSPLLRELTAEKILQPETLAGARPTQPPSTILSSISSMASSSSRTLTVAAAGSAAASSTASSFASASSLTLDSPWIPNLLRLTSSTSDGGAAAAFNVADWERCEDPFEIIERKTINDMEELKNVLESVSSTELETSEVTPAEPEKGSIGSSRPNLPWDDSQSAPSAESSNSTNPTSTTINPTSNSENAEATESSSAEAEVLSNVERPPSYDEVIGDGASGEIVVVGSAPTEGTVVMALHNLQLTSVSSPAVRKQREMSSASTPTSSGAQSIPNALVESPAEGPRDSAETDVKTTIVRETSTSSSSEEVPVYASVAGSVERRAVAAASATTAVTASSAAAVAKPSPFAAMTPTTPTASFPEFVNLPDFPSLSEADLPTNQAEDTPEDFDLSAAETTVLNAAKNDDPSVASSETEPPTYQRLSPALKVFVDKLVDMGFDMGVTSRAADHFGADEKQVIDHLCSVSLLADEGHSVSDVEEALLLNDGKDKLARKFLQALSQLRQFGFEEVKIKAALIASGNDTEKALDQLMVT